MTNEQFRMAWGNFEQECVANMISLMQTHKDREVSLPYSENNKDGKNTSLILNQKCGWDKPRTVDIIRVRLYTPENDLRLNVIGEDGDMYFPDDFVYGMMSVLYGAVSDYYYGGGIEAMIDTAEKELFSWELPRIIGWVNENVLKSKTGPQAQFEHLIFRQDDNGVWERYAKFLGTLRMVNNVASSGYSFVIGSPYCWYNDRNGVFLSICTKRDVKHYFREGVREEFRKEIIGKVTGE